ncbi:hypothetical protein V6N12_009343 [Hibiscus sabdariffa]|uniref:Uncharacterized protein n=1 Tax=Hibiscus sabdariffa TaxID=183260 RepID=A0ABR2E8U0_9ROSI
MDASHRSKTSCGINQEWGCWQKTHALRGLPIVECLFVALDQQTNIDVDPTSVKCAPRNINGKVVDSSPHLLVSGVSVGTVDSVQIVHCCVPGGNHSTTRIDDEVGSSFNPQHVGSKHTSGSVARSLPVRVGLKREPK